jgi:hypothetical protein
MHEWWEPNHLPLILAALRQLRRRRRVYLIINHSGWSIL